MPLKPLSQLKSPKGKTILIRCNFDVPLKNGQVKNNSRLLTLLPTIKYLLAQNTKLILVGHLGRPQGQEAKLSLLPVAKELNKLLDKNKIKYNDFTFIPEFDRYLSPAIKESADDLKPKDILMLQNLRFSDRESAGCKKFSKKLAELADAYVNEAFAVSHRPASSISTIRQYLPAYAGLHLDKEINNLSLKNKQSIVLIIGGAKIATKLPIINNFLNQANHILIGGAVANNFLAALGYKIGQSKFDADYLKAAKNIIKKAKNKLVVPSDVVTDQGISKINAIAATAAILDIGPETVKHYNDIIKKARTIIWNGPLGKFEDKKYAKGTLAILNQILKSKAAIVIGGGDTDTILKNKKLPKNIFVSSGGGAMLDFLAGKTLPGLK